MDCAEACATPMQIERVDNVARLVELKAEWSALVRTVPGLTPFQLPEWAITWWGHFGSGDLHTLVFRKEERMVGMLPAFVHRWKGLRQMTLIGSGITDSLDPPIDSRFHGEIVEALRAHLESNANWDICDWQDLSIDTPLGRMESGRSFEVAVKSDTECTAVSLPATLEEFWSGRSKDLRRNVTRYRKKAEKQGAVSCEVACEARPELVEGLIALHEARWRARGEPGMIAANRSAPFLREMAEEFARLGILRLFALRFEHEIAAAIVGWLHRGTLFFYMSGLQPRFEWFSPGRILLFECLRYSYEQGCRKWNFLRGTEAYK
ncbi:MAG: GNAT family N-acetyltransferase, partial [Bryobacteraceae bacterium]